MLVRTFTNRGRGIEFVEGSGAVVPRLSNPSEIKIHDGGYIEILNSNEIIIWIDPDRSDPHGDHHKFKEFAGEKQGPARIFIGVDEIRSIVEFLRANGIEVDPVREKQRNLAWELARTFEVVKDQPTSGDSPK
jgi:hypothetical protein